MDNGLFSFFRKCFAIPSLFLLLSGCAVDLDIETAVVVQVIDGDTIVIQGGEQVRYIGIDAPEKGEPYYYEAREFNEKMVKGKRVQLEKDVSDRDRFGRLLRYVYVDGVFVNREMVRNGYAFSKAYMPDIKYQSILEDAENEARILHRGAVEMIAC